MTTVLKCYPTKQPTGTISGALPNVYNARWGLEIDDQVDMRAALQLGTEVAPSATVTPIPRKGSFFSWVSPGNFRTIDKSAIALDFNLNHILNDGKKWNVDVRWRQPVPGAWEEPGRVNVHPISRRPYYWVEYYTETEEIFTSRNRIDIGTSPFDRPKGTPGPLTTAAGEEVDLATDERLHMVFVCERFVTRPQIALEINDLYFGRINSEDWEVPPEFAQLDKSGKIERSTIRKFQARFLRAETTQYPEWFHDTKKVFQFVKLQVRVRVSTRPFFKNVPNRGTWKYDNAQSKVVLHRDTDGVLGKVNLKVTGFEDTSNVPFLIPYQIAGDRLFNNRSMRFV